MTRTETVESRQELEARAALYTASRGYKRVHEGADAVTLKEKGMGSTFVHILLLLSTAGIGNLVYAIWARDKADTVEIRVGGRRE